jgi:hypothetical protein
MGWSPGQIDDSRHGKMLDVESKHPHGVRLEIWEAGQPKSYFYLRTAADARHLMELIRLAGVHGGMGWKEEDLEP